MGAHFVDDLTILREGAIIKLNPYRKVFLSLKLFLSLVIFTAYLFVFPNLLPAAEQGGFLITKINIKGNTVVSSKDLGRLIKHYEGARLTLPELQKIAALITEEYKKRGYIIATAYVPEQSIVNGTVEIAVLEGKVGEVIVQGNHRYYSTEFIRKHFDPVKNAPALNQDNLERALLVLNEYPKLSVKTTLQAGKEPGTTDLIVTADNSLPVNVTLDYNNFGSRFVSRNRYGAAFDVGNLVREGAILSARGVTGDDPDKMLYGRGAYSIPLNTLGTRLSGYYANGYSDIGAQLEALGLKGKTEAYGLYITHPFIKRTSVSLTAEFGFDIKNAKQTVFASSNQTDKNDRTRAIRGAVNYEAIDLSGRTTAAFTASQGLGDILGAMSDHDESSSRVDADNRFTKFNLDILRLQRIYPFYKGEAFVYAILRGSGQWSINNLVANEQFAVGGSESVRGYPESEFVGDFGYSVSAELRVAPLVKKDLFQLAFFIDNGGVYQRNPGTQIGNHNITGAGTGIRLNLPYDINIRADVGFAIGPDKNSEGKKTVFYVQAAKRF